MNFLDWIRAQNPPHWQTWIGHTLMCLAVCFPFFMAHELFGWENHATGAATGAMVFYILREIEQVMKSSWFGLDTVMDVVGPIGVCIAVWLIGG